MYITGTGNGAAPHVKVFTTPDQELNGWYAETPPQGACVAMIRPENVRLLEHGADGENLIPGMVEEVVYLGFHREVRVRLATGALVKADLQYDDDEREHEQGEPVAVCMPARHLRVLRAESAGDDAEAEDEGAEEAVEA